MTEEDHHELSCTLKRAKGAIILSGYPSKLYDEWYRGWFTVERDAHADGAKDRVEKLWMNYEPPTNGERWLFESMG